MHVDGIDSVVVVDVVVLAVVLAVDGMLVANQLKVYFNCVNGV